VQKPTDELSRSYISFMRVSLDQMRQNVADELYILTLFEVCLAAFCTVSTFHVIFRSFTGNNSERCTNTVVYDEIEHTFTLFGLVFR